MAATTGQRRAAALLAGALAAGAFITGATLGANQEKRAPKVVARMSLGELAGARIVSGFPGTTPPLRVRRMIREGRLSGVILFAENLPSRARGRRVIRRLQAIPRPAGLRDPLLVMVDQEGGLVKRIGGAPTVSARQMGARGPAFSRAQGRRTAANLRNLGANVDLAPVLDIARPGGTIADTDRGFGSNAARVRATAIPFARGLQARGVAATAKHFPGLGAARLNTDFAVQRIGVSKRRLRAVDEAPYRRFVAIGGEMVMLATAIYPAFSERPAAFTRAIATGELRSRLGFEGVSITDALESVAVRDFGGPARAGRAAASAGVDLLLFTDPGAAERAGSALLRGLRSGSLSRASFEAAVRRVLRLRHRLAR
ncbi:MAG TPA: glycoside hydrolase family 3 N-terminal domain-containing protein [Solirubrobacterales bacterium]